jgi:hypothetical protein
MCINLILVSINFKIYIFAQFKVFSHLEKHKDGAVGAFNYAAFGVVSVFPQNRYRGVKE